MEFQDYFPVWEKLTSAQQQQLKSSAISRTVKKGTVLHNGNLDCTGLLLIRHGQLRAYILSDEGREITLYRLFDRDICLFSVFMVFRQKCQCLGVITHAPAFLWPWHRGRLLSAHGFIKAV